MNIHNRQLYQHVWLSLRRPAYGGWKFPLSSGDPDGHAAQCPPQRRPERSRDGPLSAAPRERTPALAMAGPMTSVKEETLPHYAAALAEAGYTVLAFDNRNFGES